MLLAARRSSRKIRSVEGKGGPGCEPGSFSGEVVKEIWKPVVGFEGLYEVSSQGRVRNAIGRVLKPRWLTNTSGNRYARQNLCRAGVVKDHYIHALMLEAFVGPRPPGFEAAHLDGDSMRNVLSNLQWKSAQGNADDRVRHGTTTRGELNPMAQLSESTVRAIRADAAAGIPNRVIAQNYRMRTHNVTRIVKRLRWAHI